MGVQSAGGGEDDATPEDVGAADRDWSDSPTDAKDPDGEFDSANDEQAGSEKRPVETRNTNGLLVANPPVGCARLRPSA